MNIKKISEKDGITKFLVKGTSITFMNSIRRSVMSNVPILAIEDVTIYENDSVMFDEFLTHRLGLLPIKTDPKVYKKKDKVKFVIEKEGPCTVYGKDIKCTDPKIEIAGKKIPITKLKKGQRLKAEMVAEMDTGKEHVKWQPALVSYNEVPELVQKKDLGNAEAIAQYCPVKVLNAKGKKVILEDPYECILCKQCVEESEGALALEYSKDSFVLTVEPTGALPAEEILREAAEAIEEKAKEFKKELTKL